MDGLYQSALDGVDPLASLPPMAKACPVDNMTAAWRIRACCILPVNLRSSREGSYNLAVSVT